MSNELQLFTNGALGKVRMVNIEGKPYAVANDVAKALEYANPSKAIISHCKDDFLLWEVTDSLGRTQETKVISQGNILRLIVKAADQSVNPAIAEKAREFESWIFDEVIPSVLKTGHYETPEYQLMLETKEQLDDMKKLLMDSGVIRTNINPRHAFDRLNVRYKITTGDDNQRGLYDAIGNYFGITVPYSGNINVTVKDWILSKLSIDDIQGFILGIETETIVKSKRGLYVNLNGFGGNSVEWDKILESFGHECAYCGSTKALIPEHIVPQSLLSCENPENVDLVGNICCSCVICNKSKGKHEMEQWFRKQPSFTEAKLRKIQRHQQKYQIEER